MIAFGSESDGTCKRVLDDLEFVEVVIRDASVERVAIIQFARDKRVSEKGCRG